MDWILTYLLLLSCAGPLFAALIAKQSTIWNYRDPSLTLDNNASTCAQSGYHRYSWYVLDMGADTTVDKVHVNGRNMKNVYITVGDNDVTTGSFRGFRGNHDCNIIKGQIPSDTDHTIECFLPVTGRYITMEMLSEGDTHHQLEICEFSFQPV